MEKPKNKFKALLFGIGAYDEFKLKLDSPPNNANKIKEILIKYSYFEESDILVCNDFTKKEAINEIERLSEETTEADDLLLVFFSGHGSIYRRTGKHYLLFKDYDSNKNLKVMSSEVQAQSAFLTETLFEIISDSWNQKRLYIIDACFSAANPLAPIMPGSRSERHVFPEFRDATVGLCSSVSESKAKYIDEQNNPSLYSLFCHFFFKVIEEGLSDKDYSGHTSIKEIAAAINEGLGKVHEHLRTQYERAELEKGYYNCRIIRNLTDYSIETDYIFKTKYFYEIPERIVEGIKHENLGEKELCLEKLHDILDSDVKSKKRKDESYYKQIEDLIIPLYDNLKYGLNNNLQKLLKEISYIIDFTVDNTGDLIKYNPEYGEAINILFYNIDDDYERELITSAINELNQILIKEQQIFLQLYIFNDENGKISSVNTDNIIQSLDPNKFDICVIYFRKQAPVIKSTNIESDIITADASELYLNSLIAQLSLLEKQIIFIRHKLIDTDLPDNILDNQKIINKIWKINQKEESSCKSFLTPNDSSEVRPYLTAKLKELSPEILLKHQREREKLSLDIESTTNDIARRNEIIDAYLDWAIKQYGRLEIRGVNDSRNEIELEHVYVELKGDLTSTYERNQAFTFIENQIRKAVQDKGNLITDDEYNKIVLKVLSKNPDIHIFDDKTRLKIEPEVVSLTEAFQKERCLVILGDPGSGKTTLLKWLALALAKAMIKNEKTVQVNSNQIEHFRIEKVSPKDDEIKSDGGINEGEINNNDNQAIEDNTISLGLTRLPIMLRIAEYAQNFTQSKKEGKDLQIIDFLGYHTWMGYEPLESISKDSANLLNNKKLFNEIIREHIKNGNAVVLLDGVDEIPNFEDRHEIVLRVISFIKDHLYPKFQSDSATYKQKTKISNFTNYYNGSPKEVGGNQIIITSRIAGYHEAPITNVEMAHLTIEPMQKDAIIHFCHIWYNATIPDAEESNKKANDLVNSITDSENMGILELASNPLLVTIIALVHKNHGLPKNRSQLYAWAYELFESDHISKSKFTKEQTRIILSGIATKIHNNNPAGLVDEKELEDLFREIAGNFNGQLDAGSFELFKNSIGVIAARGHSLYGFIHLTFQEYLAGIGLVIRVNEAADKIIEKLDDPRWREPILLALGYINFTWDEDKQNELYKKLLDYQDPIGHLIPRIPLFILKAVKERFINSIDIIEKIIDKLLTSYLLAIKNNLEQFLEEHLLSGFNDIYRAKTRHYIDHYFKKTVSTIDDDTLFVWIKIIQKEEWFSRSIIEKLIDNLHRDKKEWDWIINKTLQIALSLTSEPQPPKKTIEPSKETWKKLKEADFDEYIERKKRHKIAMNSYVKKLLDYNDKKQVYQPVEVPIDKLELRRELENNTRFIQKIQEDSFLYQIITLIFGGFAFYDAINIAKEYFEIAKFLQNEDSIREAEIKSRREYYVSRWGEEDIIYNMAVYLDVGMEGKLQRSKAFPSLEAKAIYNDSKLTFLILDLLNGTLDKTAFINESSEIYKISDNEQECLDALAILFINDSSDEQINRLVQIHPHLKDSFQEKLEFAGERLKDPIFRALRNEEIQWNDLVENIRKELTGFESELFVHSIARFCAFYSEGLFTLYNSAKTDKIDDSPLLLSEIIACKLIGTQADDIVYECAVALDLLEKLSLFDFLETLTIMPLSWNFRLHSSKTRWNPENITSINQNNLVIYIPIKLIDNILIYKPEDVRSSFRHSLVSMFLRKCGDFIATQKDILIELLIIDYNNHNFSDELALLDYADELGLPRNYFDVERIKKLIEKIESPYYRARAYIRLSKYLLTESTNLLQKALNISNDIEDAFEKFEVLSYLTAESNSDITVLEQLLEKINEPLKKLFASVIYSSLKGTEKASKFIVEAVSKIDDKNLLLKAFLGFDTYFEDTGSIISILKNKESIKTDEIYYLAVNKKYGRIISQVIKQHFDKLTPVQKDIFPLISLGCKLLDLNLNFIDRKQTLENLWNNLPVEPESTVESLFKVGQKNGLTLTKVATDNINTLIEANKVSLLLKLFPLLENPSPSVTQTLNNWLSERAIRDYVILILREKDRDFLPDEIKNILSLLTSPDDRIVLRSELLIHTGLIGTKNFEERTKKASFLNREVFYEFANQQIKNYQKPILVERIKLFYSNIIFDSVPLIEELCRNIANNQQSVESFQIMVSIQYMTNDVGAKLVEEFTNGNYALQSAIIKCFGNCSARYLRETFIIELWQSLVEIIISNIEKLSPPLKEEVVLTDDLLYTLAVIADTANKIEKNLPLVEIRKLASNEFNKITPTIQFLIGNQKDTLKELSSILAEQYFESKDFTEKYNPVADMIKDQPQLFTFILELIEDYLEKNIEDSLFCPIRKHLLLVAATVVKQNQSSFNNFENIKSLIGKLKKVVKTDGRFVNRFSAVTLLGYYQEKDIEIINIIKSSFYDDVDVRNAAEEAMDRIRDVEDWIIDELIAELHVELNTGSATVALSIAKILASLGRSSKIGDRKRNKIMKDLANCVLSTKFDKPIYQFSGTGWKNIHDELKIIYKGKLNEKIYELLLKLNGFEVY